MTPEELSERLRQHHVAIGRVAWELDEFLSAIRKAKAGYRDPDPETGRIREFDGMDPAEGARRILAAARLLRALDEALDFGCPDLEGRGEGACPPGIRCGLRFICEANAQRRAGV